MRTTIDLTPEAYYHAKALARESKKSLGKIVSELIVKEPETTTLDIGVSRIGFPTLSSDRPVTSEDVARIVDEDAEEAS